jgi:hypothetical protein
VGLKGEITREKKVKRRSLAPDENKEKGVGVERKLVWRGREVEGKNKEKRAG